MSSRQAHGDVGYAAQKFAAAVYELSVRPGPIKDRLYFAYLEFCPVAERDMPHELLEDFRWIRSELTKKEPKVRAFLQGQWRENLDGRIGATLSTMRIARAVSIAERICYLADRLYEYAFEADAQERTSRKESAG
jgi:hypothetical protein